MQQNFFIGILIYLLSLSSATGQDLKIEKGYFQYPFNPGSNQTLSGSMGELRSNHFHGGIDVRTAGTTGLPILAAADGYISRIVVTSYSYGNMLYITHPNGFITVYAHLDKFEGAIADYTRTQQYLKESFDIELLPEKNQLLVKKGDKIGLSGNTGASRGAHLHFEVRDKDNNMYNPLLWGFPEIKDNIAPAFNRIAVRTLNIDARVNDAFGRAEFKPTFQYGSYQLPAIDVWGQVGIEVSATDKMNLTSFNLGVSFITLKIDEKEIFHHDLSVFHFDESKYINILLDYETLVKKGVRYERCYIADGDRMSTYKKHSNLGKISISDEKSHAVELIIGDIMGNNSTLKFNINGKKPTVQPNDRNAINTKVPDKIETQLFENTLKITAKQKANMSCTIYAKGNTTKLDPAYFKSDQAVFLYDMRKGVADSLEIDKKVVKSGYIGMIPVGKPYVYILPFMKVQFSADALFDTLYTSFNYGLDSKRREVIQMNDNTIPFYNQPTITLSPRKMPLNKERAFGYNANNWPKFEGGVWEENSITFRSKHIGKFMVIEDNDAPIITPKPKVNNTVYFQIGDGQSGIDSFKATLNGKWVLMNFDHKQRLIWSEMQNETDRLSGEFILEVKDKAGNKSTYTKTY